MNPILQKLGQQTPQLPLNNPLFAMLQAYRQGKDPISALQPFAAQDPQAAEVLNMFRNNPGQMKTQALKKAQELGLSVNDVARSLGLSLPSDR